MYHTIRSFGAETGSDYGVEPGLMEAYLPKTSGASSTPPPSSIAPSGVLPIVLAGGLAVIAILYFATR